MVSLGKSINGRKSLFVLGLATLGLFMAANPAKAVNLVNKPITDTDFNKLVDNGDFKELFVAEGRIGDRGGNATYELGINNDVKQGATPVTTGQFDWGNNSPVNFSLEYTGSAVNYLVGDKLLSSNAFSGGVTDIFLRTRAADNSSITLSNLLFDSVGVGNLFSSVTGSGSDVDYLQLSQITAPFKLTGQALLSWTGTQPKNSALAYQIKVGSSIQKSVPEPATVAGIFLAGIVGAGYSKRKKQAQKQA